MILEYVTPEGTYSLDHTQIEALYSLQYGPVEIGKLAGFMAHEVGDIHTNELLDAGLIRLHLPSDGSEPTEVEISNAGRILLWELAEVSS